MDREELEKLNELKREGVSEEMKDFTKIMSHKTIPIMEILVMAEKTLGHEKMLDLLTGTISCMIITTTNNTEEGLQCLERARQSIIRLETEVNKL